LAIDLVAFADLAGSDHCVPANTHVSEETQTPEYSPVHKDRKISVREAGISRSFVLQPAPDDRQIPSCSSMHS
jgi:hypothetical protein